MYNKYFIPLLIILVIGLSACNKTAPQSSIKSYSSSFAPVESSVQEEKVVESQSAKEDESVSAFGESSAIVEEDAESSVDDIDDFFNRSVMFTDGAGLTEPTALAVGDSFLGWRVASYLGIQKGSQLVNADVQFEGTLQVKGTLQCAPKDLWADNLRFFITDDANAKMLPMAVGDDRIIWFLLNDTEETRSLAETMQSNIQAKGETYNEYYEIEDCEIIIKDYFYIYLNTACANSAELAEVICIPGIVSP